MQSLRATLSVSSPPCDRAVGVVRVTAVLAPAERAQQQRERPPNSQRNSSAGWLSAFRAGPRANEAERRAVVALEEATKARANEADAIEEREKAAKQSEPLPDISAFLRPAGVMEARYVRLLSSLSALTYHLDKLTPSSLMRRHRLRLVSTSKVCELKLREPRASPADVAVLADAMAADPGLVAAAQAEIEASEQRAEASPAMRAVARVSPLSSADFHHISTVISAASSPVATPATASSDSATAGTSAVDRVAASLASAAAAASSAAQGVYSAAVPYAGPLANNISTFTASVTSSLPVKSVAAQLQSAAAVGHSGAIATVATVSAALESSWSASRGRLPKECQSPTEWFIADDAASHTRYFVIQGSDNLDHWRVNLTFDPVPFEEPELGVRVHRGVYEAATALYHRFLPLVQDHLATSPFAKVAFTGHSLGGSLGTLLMLMYVKRGVLPRSAIVPTYTFGAPAVFCEGGCSAATDANNACACPPTAAAAATSGAASAASGSSGQPCGAQCGGSSSGATGGLLQALGLPEGAVRNVLMARDIVPRAFACNYSLVADLLKRVSDSFREHRCLNSSRTVMFDFIGKVMILEPDDAASYVAGEGHHPLLPPGPGLYVVREPTPLNNVAATLKRDASFVSQAVQHAISNLPTAAAAATTAAATTAGQASTALAVVPSKPKALARIAPPPRPVANAREAVWELMNHPHPLDILADPSAYGDLGAISRYHNPDNYTRALGGVLAARGTRFRRLVANAADTCGMRYFTPVLDPAQQRLLSSGTSSAAAAAAAAGVLTSVAPAADRRASPGGKQALRMVPRGGSSSNLSAGGGSGAAPGAQLA